MDKDLITEVADYYTDKLAEHGATPQGVDWNGTQSQRLRFAQLVKVIDSSASEFSVNDLGCGYGALYDYLASRYNTFKYTGYDVSGAMVDAALMRFKGALHARFAVASAPAEIADYGVASGIFNVRLGRSDAEWRGYLEATLDSLHATSLRGFSFNCLTAYSDSERKRDYLYYPEPAQVFDLCERRYARNVALLHDYGLYEFTIIVRKAND